MLTDRVVRLLLSGAAPGRILCLTFTKAAAATVAIRVHERLGRWVTLPEAALAAEIAELEGRAPEAARVARARRLFAAAVETPGGLKIETLHGFCERLLHLAPFEANVPARFAVLDEVQAAELVAASFENVLADAAGEADPTLAAAMRIAVAEAGGTALRAAVLAAVRCRAVLDAPDAALCGLRRALDLSADETPALIEARMVAEGLDDLPALAAALRTGKARDEERAEALALASAATPGQRLARYRAVFFTGDGAPRAPSTLGTKAVPEALRARLIAEQARLVALDDRLRAARAFERTEALFTLAVEIDRRVAAQKARLGALDFDDLVHRALMLLRRVDSGWLLYKLDRGIDHVLVDEAQDTNPEHWEILRLVTADFTAGEGARGEAGRTRFAVGDPKQSIYAFQGAAPREFEATRRVWRRETVQAALRFEDVTLTLSFRSARAVLSAVDATFAVPAHYRGLGFDDAAVGTTHETARPLAPGQVELWPVEAPGPEAVIDPFDPPEHPSEEGVPAVALARRVASAIRAWTREGDESGRRWRPGEILVLLRKRGPAFEGVIRALRALRVPVAGEDRLDVAAHIAVLDLVAAGRAALLPEDDLTLACALKSPLVGLDDDDLVRIAARRGDDVSLAAALAAHAARGDAAAIRGAAALAGWRALARAHGPFGFYLHLTGPGGGRARLVARLGVEAGDAIDVFLAAAQTAETGADAPSLTRFLARYEPRGGLEVRHTVRRDPESGRDEVRVMTVHGAKGLEAPLVVLIDGCEVGGPEPALLPVPAPTGTPVTPAWSTKGGDSAALSAAREAYHEAAREEHNRLLYVAMTRAADRLVVAPYRTKAETPETAWCAMVRRGLVAAAGGLVQAERSYGPVEFWQEGAAAAEAHPPAEHPPAVPPPDWLHRPLAPESAAPAGGEASGLQGGRVADPEARRAGGLVRALLEHLPDLAPDRRAAAARAYLAARAPALPAAAHAGIARDALRILAAPELAALFAPGSRAEVAVAGTVAVAGALQAVSERVERLAVGADAARIAAFVAGPPAADPAHLRALARQARLVAAIHPGLPVRVFLVWTIGPTIREVAPAALAAALETTLDGVAADP